MRNHVADVHRAQRVLPSYPPTATRIGQPVPRNQNHCIPGAIQHRASLASHNICHSAGSVDQGRNFACPEIFFEVTVRFRIPTTENSLTAIGGLPVSPPVTVNTHNRPVTGPGPNHQRPIRDTAKASSSKADAGPSLRDRACSDLCEGWRGGVLRALTLARSGFPRAWVLAACCALEIATDISRA